MSKKTRYALVLSGGGFKGAFQLGALQYLSENWETIAPDAGPMHFDIIAGVSVGALNGAMLAMEKMEALNDLWESVARNGVGEIYTSPFIDTESQSDRLKFKLDASSLKERFLPDFDPMPSLLKGLGMILSKKKRDAFLETIIEDAADRLQKSLAGFKGLADNQPLREKLELHIDQEAILRSKYFCGFVSLQDGQYVSVSHRDFSSREDFINGVLASTVIPIVWPPVEEINYLGKNVRNLVDGGIRNISPLGDVIREINEQDDPDVEYVVFILNCSNGQIDEQDFNEANIFQIAMRSLQEITLSEIFDNDVNHFMRINDIVQQVKAENPGFKIRKDPEDETSRELKAFKTVLIQPEGGILGDMLVANENLVNLRIGHGKARAEAAVDAYLEQLRGQMMRRA